LNYLGTHSSVYEIINLGNNKPVNLRDMVMTIEKTLNQKAMLDRLPMQQGDVEITYADISKAERLLTYKVNTTFTSGIDNFSKWSNLL
jgi:UDP-glucuronate 4-epimerase